VLLSQVRVTLNHSQSLMSQDGGYFVQARTVHSQFRGGTMTAIVEMEVRNAGYIVLYSYPVFY